MSWYIWLLIGAAGGVPVGWFGKGWLAKAKAAEQAAAAELKK